MCCSAEDYWAKQREEERASRYEQRKREREKEKQQELRKQPAAAAKPAAPKVQRLPTCSVICLSIMAWWAWATAG